MLETPLGHVSGRQQGPSPEVVVDLALRYPLQTVSPLLSSVGSLEPGHYKEPPEQLSTSTTASPVTVAVRELSCPDVASSEPSRLSFEAQEKPLQEFTGVATAIHTKLYAQEDRVPSEMLQSSGLNSFSLPSVVAVSSRNSISAEMIHRSKGLASVRLLTQHRASNGAGKMSGIGADNLASLGEPLSPSPSSSESSQLARKVRFIDGFVTCPHIKPGVPNGNDIRGVGGGLTTVEQLRGSGRKPYGMCVGLICSPGMRM